MLFSPFPYHFSVHWNASNRTGFPWIGCLLAEEGWFRQAALIGTHRVMVLVNPSKTRPTKTVLQIYNYPIDKPNFEEIFE